MWSLFWLLEQLDLCLMYFGVGGVFCIINCHFLMRVSYSVSFSVYMNIYITLPCHSRLGVAESCKVGAMALSWLVVRTSLVAHNLGLRRSSGARHSVSSNVECGAALLENKKKRKNKNEYTNYTKYTKYELWNFDI